MCLAPRKTPRATNCPAYPIISGSGVIDNKNGLAPPSGSRFIISTSSNLGAHWIVLQSESKMNRRTGTRNGEIALDSCPGEFDEQIIVAADNQKQVAIDDRIPAAFGQEKKDGVRLPLRRPLYRTNRFT